MDVSIVIINYNTFTLTCACIESIISNTKAIDYEIILVDNNSIENDPDKFLQIFPTIVLIKSDKNVGFAKGNNLGIAKVKGDYILLINSDTILKNDAVSIVKLFLDTNPNVAAASARLEYPNGQVQHNCQRFPSIKYGLFELLRLQKFISNKISGKILFGPFFSYNSVAYPDWIWGTFFMFERKKLEKLPNGKLADDFFMYVEDVQWCKDFRKAGYQIGFEPNAKVIHYLGKSGGAKNEMMLQNTALFMGRNYSKWEIRIIRLIDKILRGK